MSAAIKSPFFAKIKNLGLSLKGFFSKKGDPGSEAGMTNKRRPG
jgi:hypothetical protein